jgi:hypothetical protein
MSNVLEPNQELKQKTSLWSANRACELRMQDDGNLVVYQGAQPIWDAWSSPLAPTWKTADHPNQNVVLKMQDDGNLVIYDLTGGTQRPLWESDTVLAPGTNRCYLRVQDDSNLVIYLRGDGQEVARWDIRSGRLY